MAIRETGDMEEFADIRAAFDSWRSRFDMPKAAEWEVKGLDQAFEDLALRIDELRTRESE